MTITFSSGFATHIEAMLEWRTALGYTRRSLAYPMLSFDRFCRARQLGEPILTRELATAWCQVGTRVEWPAYKGHAIRELGKYLRLVGVEAFVLPAAWISDPVRRLPHIFTDDELTGFFRAADSVSPSRTSPFREYTIPVVVGSRSPSSPAAISASTWSRMRWLRRAVSVIVRNLPLKHDVLQW